MPSRIRNEVVVGVGNELLWVDLSSGVTVNTQSFGAETPVDIVVRPGALRLLAPAAS